MLGKIQSEILFRYYEQTLLNFSMTLKPSILILHPFNLRQIVRGQIYQNSKN